MQDFYAVLAKGGPAFAEVRTRRLSGGPSTVVGASSILREDLPELIDTRHVRAELLRLRRPRGGVLEADGRRGA